MHPLPVQRLGMLGANVRKGKGYSRCTCEAQGGTPSPQSLLGYGHGHGHGHCRPFGRGLPGLVEAGFYVSGLHAKMGEKNQKIEEKVRKELVSRG